MSRNLLEPAVGALLTTLERGREGFSLEPLSASGNNRVYKLHCEDDTLVLKWYFHHVGDTRDRLGAEYAFLEHAWAMGLRCIPQPLGKDEINHLALYEFVDGYKLESEHVDEAAVRQAADFLTALNSPHSRSRATSLPDASEACFSVAAHFAIVESRIARLESMPEQSDVDRAASAFVRKLSDYWQSAKIRLLDAWAARGLNPDASLPADERILSPSDFGFHNALVRPDGNLCFIDFEYAGWDDPAKALGDFFSHPGVAVPHSLFEPFLVSVLSPFEQAQRMAARVRILEPLSQFKWCCIILNEFLPEAFRRRNFANPGTDQLARKRRQLEKATQLFESLQHRGRHFGIRRFYVCCPRKH
jgi:hypothetical protein